MEHGLSIRTLAKITGVSPSTVQRDRARDDVVLPDGSRRVTVGPVMGIDGRVRPSRRVDTSARDAEIRERRARGESMRVIASAVGCSPGTVHRVLSSGA